MQDTSKHLKLVKATALQHGYDKLANEIQVFLQDKIATIEGKSQDNQMKDYIYHLITNKYFSWDK